MCLTCSRQADVYAGCELVSKPTKAAKRQRSQSRCAIIDISNSILPFGGDFYISVIYDLH